MKFPNDLTGCCPRKVTYATRGQARRAKRAMHRKTGQTFKTYRCPFCGKRHIAHR